jgi:excisionase family DNA binding protein
MYEKVKKGKQLISFDAIDAYTKWLTTKEAARYLKITEGTLRNLVSSGQVKYHKRGRHNRYRIEDLDVLVECKEWS